MSINISAKTDYSYLFSGLSTGNSQLGSTSFSLADYASIKNGSYGKLMKAYYGRDDSKVKSSVSKLVNSNAADQAKTISALKSSTDSLKKVTGELMATGKDSIFAEKDLKQKDENGVETTVKGYDTDAIYKKVSAFADAYNSVISAALKSDNSRVLRAAAGMTTESAANEKMLAKIGITIGEDNKLSVDEKAFKEADMSTVKTMMNGLGSYAYDMNAKASMINMYAQQDAAKTGGLYAQNATYQTSQLSNGYNFSSWF